MDNEWITKVGLTLEFEETFRFESHQRCCACDSAFADVYIKRVHEERLPCRCGRCIPMPDTPAYRANRYLLSRWQPVRWLFPTAQP